MSPKLPQPSRGITRVDQESTRTHGYVGRLGYSQTVSGWRPAYKAFFGDASHGGRPGALKAAESWLRATRKRIAAEGGMLVKPATKRAKTAAKKGATKKTVAKKTAKKSAARRVAAKKGATRRPAVRVATRKRKAAASAR
jgi:DNA-binding protein HU-beta